jgi:large repetitive protein
MAIPVRKSVTRTYQITDVCGNTQTCTQTITIDPDPVTYIPPQADLANSCDFANQSAVDADFAAWVAAQTAAFNIAGGCDPVLTNNAPSAGPTHCTGGFITVTWNISDLCEDINVGATYTLTAAPAVTSSSPSSTTEESCDFADQAAVNADFAAWVAAQTAQINVGGGCDPQISNNAPATGPAHCTGGAITVTWTITDLCLSPDITYTATYTLNAAPAVTSSSPTSTTEESCDFADQAAVNADFAAWVAAQTAQINVGGGCDPQISNNAPATGPAHCTGGAITVTWTITDLCLSPDITYTATYTLNAAPAVTSSSPTSTTEESCDFADQAAVNADFAAWVAAQTAQISCWRRM